MSDAPSPDATRAADNPIAPAAIEKELASLHNLWKRIEKRAPPAIRARVDEVVARAADIASRQAAVRERIELAKAIEDLGAELRGRRPWEPTFYRDGRLAVVRAQDPITIRGAIDHVRLEAFYERYVRRADAAFERLEYFFSRVGLLAPEEKKVERKPWEMPYINFDSYRELLWGKVARNAPRVRRE